MSDVDPFEDDDKPHPDEWEGEKPTDSNGRRYNPYQGSQTPTEGRCNGLLSNWKDRYGEPRYCSALPENCFIDGGSDHCRMHKSRDALMDRHKELFKHGAFAKNYSNVFDNLDTLEQIEAIQTFNDLIDESAFDFDCEEVEWAFDLSENGDVPFDELEETIRIPQRKRHAAKALWMATLDLAKMERINVIQFDDGMQRDAVVAVTDEGSKITELEENHLHLTYSRLSKDWEKHLEIGGVTDDNTSDTNVTVNDPKEFVVDVDDLGADDEDADPEEQFPATELEDED